MARIDAAPQEETREEDQEILERFALESAFAALHKDDSDEMLLDYLRDCAAALNHLPTKKEVIGCRYLKERFGPWNRVLEKAGLKQLTENRKAKMTRYKTRRRQKDAAV